MKSRFKPILNFAVCISLALVCGLFAVRARDWSIAAERRLSSSEESLGQIRLALSRPVAAAQVGDRLISLPEDGDQWYCSLFLHADWAKRPADRRLVAAFSSDPTLLSLRAQTHYRQYTDTEAIYGERFKSAIPVLPALLIQRPGGEVVYKESGEHVGRDWRGLSRAICRQVARHCPDGRCGPLPEPKDETPKEEIPTLDDTPREAVAPKKEDPLWTLLLAGFIGAGAAAAAKVALIARP